MNCTVITPTTGSHHLAKAMESTNDQPCEHWIVVDGEEYFQTAAEIFASGEYFNKRIILLPENTGKPKRFHSEMPTGRDEQPEDRSFYGHRIYCAMAYLINSPYVLFLDEDNWYDSNHVESMLNLMGSGNLDWCYSLRRLVDQEGCYIDEDNCDSLGVFANFENINCVDLNCFGFRTSYLLRIVSSLYMGSKADKTLYKQAVANTSAFVPIACTGTSTVNYRLSRVSQHQWFADGNKKMHALYSGNFPWRTKF
jgi:hypothetical protein